MRKIGRVSCFKPPLGRVRRALLPGNGACRLQMHRDRMRGCDVRKATRARVEMLRVSRLSTSP